ncbi:hypothetical protein FPJ27_15775 [Burkholderia sp. MS455]|nr:hypothetical protein FPJ27_15775 [Burkholderia sp. MS455]
MRSRGELLAAAPPLEMWPSLDAVHGENKDAEEIDKRVVAIKMLTAGKTYRQIRLLTGLHRSTVRRLMTKCLEVAEDGRIQGYRALVPYVHLRPNVRQTSIGAKRPEQHGGMSGALGAILARFPDLSGSLSEKIKRDKSGKPTGYHPTGMALVRFFHSALRNRKVGPNEWPFNTKYGGRRSIARYMRSLLYGSFDDIVEHKGNSDAKALAATGKGYSLTIPCEEPFDIVEIDAYHVDAFLSVLFETPDGTTTEVTLQRLWLLAVVDRLTTAILAYSVVFSSEVTADDVVAVMRRAIVNIWKPKKLTIPVEYLPGSGLPSGVIPDAANAVWTLTMLDGALANLATKIHDVVRRSAGFMINWGPPGHFEHRPNVEKTFSKIASNVFKRLPSTTGKDPKHGRAKDAIESATKYSVRADEVEQLVDVHWAEHNATPGERNYFRSPLETMQQFLCGDNPKCMLRRVPTDVMGRPRLAYRRVVKTVRGSVTSGRRPYIQLENVRYTNPLLANSAWLIGKEIIIYVDDDDLRQVWAYLATGEEYGVLVADGKWGMTKHSLTTRKAIFSLVYRRVIVLSQTCDPVADYLNYLAGKAVRKGKHAGPAPKAATEAVRVANDAGMVPRFGQEVDAAHASSIDIEPVSAPLKLSVLKPLPEDFFTVKNETRRR